VGASARLLTRRPGARAPQPGIEPIGWDGTHVPGDAVADLEWIAHLSGEPLFGGLPTAARRERIRSSRIASTRSLVDAIAALPASRRPRTLVCASATGYYGARGETPLDERAGRGEGFLARLCEEWEQEAARAEQAGVRVVSLRIGVVLAREGGALAAMLPIFRLGLGGRLGDGRQWFSWIHADDLVALIRRSAETPDLRGPLNAVAPGPVRNAEFTAELARRVRRPAFLPVPGVAVRLALGELAGELLGSRRVVPARAVELGFAFRHPTLPSALDAEIGRKPS
jgi:hypothetical protein